MAAPMSPRNLDVREVSAAALHMAFQVVADGQRMRAFASVATREVQQIRVSAAERIARSLERIGRRLASSPMQP